MLHDRGSDDLKKDQTERRNNNFVAQSKSMQKLGKNQAGKGSDGDGKRPPNISKLEETYNRESRDCKNTANESLHHPRLAAAGSGRLRQIHFQDRHVERVRHVAVLYILEDDADELAVDVDLDRVVLLRPFDDCDRVEAEKVAQVFFDAPEFAAGHVGLLGMA